jgi:surface antigen
MEIVVFRGGAIFKSIIAELKETSMSSFLEKDQSATKTEQSLSTTPLPFPEPVSQELPVPQLPFPDSPPQDIFQPPGITPPLTDPTPAPAVTRPLEGYIPLPIVTRVLPELQTGALSNDRNPGINLRQPIVIRGTGKKSSGSMRPPKGRRLVIHIAVTALLILIVLGTLMAVVPTGSEGTSRLNPFTTLMNFANNNSRNTALLPQQAATATAVTQDGFDPGNGTYAGVQGAPADATGGSLDRFFYGQCTYWANMRYHELTGHWVPWLGNAAQWYYGARMSGWAVSAMPHVPSILVLQPGVQEAGWYGHVAIVEKINSDGSVLTSNWNWQGSWARETLVTFRPGSGVSFLWFPGA